MNLAATAAAAELPGLMAGIPATDPGYGQWWATDDGTWLYSEIRDRIGVPLCVQASDMFGVVYEPEDVANTAVILLRRTELHPYITAAVDPWSYLASSLKRQLRTDAGAYFRVELDEAARSSLIGYEDDYGNHPGLADCVRKTYEQLCHFSSPEFHTSIEEAVWYFAERGHTRLSHLYSLAAKDPALTALGLSRENILAIANAVLGSRPDHGKNSLLAGYLSSHTFDPSSSIPHRLALKKFASRLTRTAIPAAMSA